MSDDLIREAKAKQDPAGHGKRPRVAVVTCMDARIDPLRILDLRLGEAHVVRNGGGVITEDVIRSLAVSQRRFHTTAVDVLMHTDCGMQRLEDEALRREISAEAGRPIGLAFHGFDDLEAELRRGVAALRNSPFLAARAQVRGLVYDVTTGLATVVVS